MLLLSALLTVGLVHCFNLSPQHALLIADPRRRDADTYFGYSVALQRDDKQYRVIVGAPQADSGVAAHETQHRPGVVYSCTAAHGCKQLVLDQSGGLHNRRYKNQVLNERRSGAWIGGALDVLDEGGGVLVCGPRWRNEDSGHFLMNGICYLKNSETEEAGKLLPLITRARQALHNDTFYYAYGEAGVSTHLHKDGLELLIGAPGVLEWAGTVIRYRFKRHLSVRAEYTRNIPRPNTDDIGYFGYAVSSGQFRHNYTYYVGGAPRGSDMRGTVLVFDYRSKDDDYIDVVVQLNGTQVGEYFGAVVCVVDVNGDGLDDLLVGAPLYSLPGREGDEGRVYVYVNREGTLSTTATAMLMGNSSAGGRFGSAIADLGDLNHDGFHDVAVGAPYEGRGAVYIYMGQQAGVSISYSQRIAAADISPQLSGFGISISRGLDVDGNHYNDVSVGAYDSDHAVVFFSRPVVTLNASLNTHVAALDVDAKHFNLTACLSYAGVHRPASVDVHVELHVKTSTGKAMFPSGSGNHSYSAHLELSDCQTFSIQLTGQGSDVTRPILVNMTYRISNTAESESGAFCKTCPVVDPRLPAWIVLHQPYNTGCGDDDTCQPDLSVLPYFALSSPRFLLGSSASVVLHVAVRNSGEPAYRVRVSVRLAQGAPLLRLPATCREVEVDDELECDLANPLHADEEVTLLLEVDMSGVSSVDELVYSLNVTSDGDERTPENNTATLTLPLWSEATAEVSGSSLQSTRVFSKTNQTHSAFTHTYELRNLGPSPVSVATVQFHLPTAVRAVGGHFVHFLCVFKPEVTHNGAPGVCTTLDGVFALNASDCGVLAATPRHRRRDVDLAVGPRDEDAQLPWNRTLYINCSDSEAVQCMTVQCTVGPLFPTRHKTVIKLSMQADTSKLIPVLKARDIMVIASTASATITSDNNPVFGHVGTVFYGTLPDEPVAMWVWVVAVVVGILIIALIGLGLYKMGFFKRQKRQELENLKKHVDVEDYNLAPPPTDDADIFGDSDAIMRPDAGDSDVAL